MYSPALTKLTPFWAHVTVVSYSYTTLTLGVYSNGAFAPLTSKFNNILAHFQATQSLSLLQQTLSDFLSKYSNIHLFYLNTTCRRLFRGSGTARSQSLHLSVSNPTLYPSAITHHICSFTTNSIIRLELQCRSLLFVTSDRDIYLTSFHGVKRPVNMFKSITSGFTLGLRIQVFFWHILSDSTLAPLQRVLHAAARFVLDLRPRDHVTAALQLLHWLSVHQCITYKLCVLMHGVAFGYAPTYLVSTWRCRATLDTPGREHLQSVDSGQYDVPRVSSRVGSRAFSVAGPQAWNQLPASLRHTNCVATFKRHLKTILLTTAYGVTDN